MATFPVKYINNTMRGAPQVSGTVGSLLAAIRAFLLTGFGQVTALSVTVAGGIATASLQAGQSFGPYCVVWVEGATPAELNGEQRVLTASNTSITWATTAADGAATGTIKIKVAPVGQWEEVFTGTNKAVFRSTDVQGARFYYWIDDTGTTSTRVRGYESMTDIDTGTGPFPTDAQISGGGYWHKSAVANATAVPYQFGADGRVLLESVASYAPTNASLLAAPVRGFGDMVALAPGGDVWCAAVACSGFSAPSSDQGAGAFDCALTAGASAIYLARDISGLGGAVATAALAYVGSTAASGNDATLGKFPSSVDGQAKLSRRYVYQQNAAGDRPPRAAVPGVLHIPQTDVKTLISPFDSLPGSGEFAGRVLRAFACTSSSVSSVPQGIGLMDTTGPWR